MWIPQLGRTGLHSDAGWVRHFLLACFFNRKKIRRIWEKEIKKMHDPWYLYSSVALVHPIVLFLCSFFYDTVYPRPPIFIWNCWEKSRWFCQDGPCLVGCSNLVPPGYRWGFSGFTQPCNVSRILVRVLPWYNGSPLNGDMYSRSCSCWFRWRIPAYGMLWMQVTPS